MRVIFLFFLHIFSRFLFHFCVLGISFSSSEESENLFVIILLFLLILLDCCFNGDKTILHFFNEHVSCPSDLVLSLHTVFFCSWSSSSDDESTATLRFFFIPFTNSIFYKRISIYICIRIWTMGWQLLWLSNKSNWYEWPYSGIYQFFGDMCQINSRETLPYVDNNKKT